MPVTLRKLESGKVRVSTPGGVKAKATTMKKAKAQERLLNAVEHGWKPTGIPKKAVRKVHHSPTMTQIDCSKLHTSKNL